MFLEDVLSLRGITLSLSLSLPIPLFDLLLYLVPRGVPRQCYRAVCLYFIQKWEQKDCERGNMKGQPALPLWANPYHDQLLENSTYGSWGSKDLFPLILALAKRPFGILERTLEVSVSWFEMMALADRFAYMSRVDKGTFPVATLYHTVLPLDLLFCTSPFYETHMYENTLLYPGWISATLIWLLLSTLTDLQKTKACGLFSLGFLYFDF